MLGYGAIVPIAVGSASAVLLPDRLAAIATDLTVLWGSAVLLVLSGVYRGLSFRSPGGPAPGQVATSIALFGLGFGALVLSMAMPTGWRTASASMLLAAGYASLIVLDPMAARRGEVPPFFARLRPVQMLIPAVSLGLLLVLDLSGEVPVE